MADSAPFSGIVDGRDLAKAARVHYSFLPAPINNDQIDLAVHYQPVQTLGGDFCSAFWISDQRLMICMCDVTGHGVASALYAARINSFVLSHAASAAHPCDLLTRLNRFLVEHLGDVGIYSTFFSTCLDVQNMQLTYANAAHPPPLCHCNASGESRILESETTLLGVGLISMDQCQHRSVPLQSGDKLLVYTDGLVERIGLNGLGGAIQRLRRFTQEHAWRDSGDFNAQLVAFSYAEWGIPHDDFLALTLSVK